MLMVISRLEERARARRRGLLLPQETRESLMLLPLPLQAILATPLTRRPRDLQYDETAQRQSMVSRMNGEPKIIETLKTT